MHKCKDIYTYIFLFSYYSILYYYHHYYHYIFHFHFFTKKTPTWCMCGSTCTQFKSCNLISYVYTTSALTHLHDIRITSMKNQPLNTMCEGNCNYIFCKGSTVKIKRLKWKNIKVTILTWNISTYLQVQPLQNTMKGGKPDRVPVCFLTSSL